MNPEQIFSRRWWTFLLRGIIAIAFGIIALAWPAATVGVFFVLFGVFVLADGIVDVIMAVVFAVRKEKWGALMAKGLVGVLIGAVVLSRPEFALELLLILIGIWAIVAGIVEVVNAFEMAPESGRGWIGVAGALAVILGILFLAIPFKTVFAAIILIAIYALVSGALLIILAFFALGAQKGLKMKEA